MVGTPKSSSFSTSRSSSSTDGRDDFEDEGVASGHVMAFGDVVHGLDGFEEGAVLGAVATQAHDGEHFEVQRLAVDIHAIAADDAGVFHAAHAFGGGGGGEADLAPQFRVGDSSVLLQVDSRFIPISSNRPAESMAIARF